MPNMRTVYRGTYGVSIALVAAAGVGVAWSGARYWRSVNSSGAESVTPKGANTYQLVTGDDSDQDRRQWDTLFSTQNYVFGREPAAFLYEHIHLLPVGRALDIAMSEGRNAVFLAKKGFSVDGVDYSDVAIRKARVLAKENGVTIHPINADLNGYQIRPDTYDVILNINFLLRPLVSQIKRGLRRGGVVVFENYTVEQRDNALGQSLRRDYLLERGELRELFKDFEILVYRETNDGKDAVASLIARKP